MSAALVDGEFVNAQDGSQATPAPSVSVVTANDVFLRGGPGAEYLPVGALIAGDPIRPVSRNENTTWIMIVYRRGFGWIRSDLAFWTVDLSALPLFRRII